MGELELSRALSGIYVLRGVDSGALDQIVQSTIAAYTGPDPGGLDVMEPNADGDAWLLLGRWADCFAAHVQEAARMLLAQLRESAELADAGSGRISIVPWLVVHGPIIERVDPGRWKRWHVHVFPHVPSWIGMHMDAPHWLGTGVNQDGARIQEVTPYARLDLRADGTVMFTGVAEDAMLRAWIPQLEAALALV